MATVSSNKVWELLAHFSSPRRTVLLSGILWLPYSRTNREIMLFFVPRFKAHGYFRFHYPTIPVVHQIFPQFHILAQTDMEEARLHISATKEVHNVHMRHMPDVQRDVDFVMEHLNDPNFDLTQPAVIESTNRYIGEDNSSAINVDESVMLYPSLLTYISNHTL